MLDLLRSKGVRVNEDRNGFKADGEEGLMKFWMVRVKDSGDDMYFCCGFDMLGNGRLVISHKDYPIDENIFESLQDAIKRNEGVEYPAEQILLMPDVDYYQTADAEREDDEPEDHFGYCDVVMTSNDDADIYTFTALCDDHHVLSGRVYKDEDSDEVRLHGDIRQHWDIKQPEEKGRTEIYERKKFYENAVQIIEMCVCEMCEQMGREVMRFFEI